MNILYISREYPPSKRSAGIGTYTKEISTGMARRGHNVFVIAASDNISHNTKEIIEGVTVYRLKGGDFYVYKNIIGKILSKVRSILSYNSYRRKVYKKILEIIDEKKIEIIEIPEYGNEGKFWLRNKTIPTIVRFHGPRGFNRDAKKFEFNNNREVNELLDTFKADAISFVSKSMKELIIKEPIIKNQIKDFLGPSIVIPNSIAIDFVVNKKKIGKEIKILGAGTISKTKGWGELIEACNQLRLAKIPLVLKIYGRYTTFGKMLNKRIKKSKELAIFIELPGPVDKLVLFEQYANADICCFPSWYEPFGLTVIEAMAHGAIVIASNSGGGCEIIENGFNGFLVQPQSVNDLKRAIYHIINLNEEEKQKIRINARKTVEEKFSNKTVLNFVESFYKSFTANHNDN